MKIGLIFEGQVTFSPPFLLGLVKLFALATLAHKGGISELFGADGHLTSTQDLSENFCSRTMWQSEPSGERLYSTAYSTYSPV